MTSWSLVRNTCVSEWVSTQRLPEADHAVWDEPEFPCKELRRNARQKPEIRERLYLSKADNLPTGKNQGKVANQEPGS